jgi:7,8-dihydropterin-6-yl-methyl-4-(beta-D-ribofuranosyl)aminobenzene 5'-phosphate synthase
MKLKNALVVPRLSIIEEPYKKRESLLKEIVELREASKVEIVSLMDNTVDLLSSNSRKEVQSFRQWIRRYTELPFAEHGFSMLVRVFNDQNRSTIIFDTGISPMGAKINAERMGIDLEEISYVVLSHGHYDHFGGLPAIIKAINKIDLPIIAHEDMTKRRGTVSSKRKIREHPNFPRSEVSSTSKMIFTKKPILIASNLACITGEIPRIINYEKGATQNIIFDKNSWKPDPLIQDDRALVINVKDKGLVVISGCAHAGIINTIRCAQQITGISKIYAVLGGFHLSGKEFEKRIGSTVKEFKNINPELIIPCHCSGWQALNALHKEFPNAVINNSVGNLYML